jgi:hypothetical protein
MLDLPTDQSLIKKIFDLAEVMYFPDDLRCIIESVIRDLYYSHQEQVFMLRINHIDRAIIKYTQAKEKTTIRNTKQYFKACILSAILESGLDELRFPN